MLKNYLNQNVVIEEKVYHCPSTLKVSALAAATGNKTEGILTAIDDDYIELDNKMLIARKFIYRIILK